MKRLSLLIGLALWVQIVNGTQAAELTLKVTDKAPPKELDASIAKTLQPKAVQLLDGDKPAFEFWFAKEIPLKSKPSSLAKAMDALEQTTILGAVSVTTATRDYRNDELAAGVYTMRYALQQQDGNHLGSTEFLYFIVLVPAKMDTKPDAFTSYDPLVKASAAGAGEGTTHPVVLSLRPATAEGGEPPQLQSPAPEHKSVRVKVPAKTGDEKTSLTFEVVYEGHVNH